MNKRVLYIALTLALLTMQKTYAQDSLARKANAAYKAQSQKLDSIKKKVNLPGDSVRKTAQTVDSVYHSKYKSLDSLQQNFNHRTDSIQKAFAGPMKDIDSRIAKLKHKQDSLTKLNLPTTSYTHKIDSLQQVQSKKLNELNSKVEKVKKETLGKVSSLKLPPEAQKEVTALTKNVQGFSVPNNFFKMPNMNLKMPGLDGSSLKLPSDLSLSSVKLPKDLSIPSAKIPSLQKLEVGSLQIPSLSQMQGSLKELSQVKSLSKMANSEGLQKEALSVASQNSEVKSVLQDEAKVKQMKDQLSKMKDTKKADSMAMQQLQPAVNHFAGKEQELKAAMDQVSKLKQKYSSVKSLADLPKRAPNPLKDKPWIERVVPGLNYFIQSRQYTMVDFNPYVGWRFTPRLTASIGWNQRIGISHGHFRTRMYDRVHGIRTSVTMAWTHGIVFTLAPEVMSAYIPTNSSLDEKHQALVWGIYAGIRKDFPIYKRLKGYSEVMYNFTQQPGRNVYGDPVSFRFGMELMLKKKAKSSKAPANK
ncbi:hypothetical protein WSM22_47030 [Cytophagales bacterium WSM2-2]|nr:hypothetical protein WSM22_47030 [Cytophagales bacterium WSM2-2]